MEDIRVHPSLLTPHLWTRLTLAHDRIACFMPELLFDLIPVGTQTITQPLNRVLKVSVETNIEERRFLVSELFVILGILLFVGPGSGVLAIVAILVGIAFLLASIRTQLVMHDISGSTLTVPVSYLDRETVRNFARTVNTVLVSRALGHQ
jgi:predicted lysophospholipase L1 biosynthesis ABC-type transport system permease subunit